MPHQPFLPHAEAARVPWINKFVDALQNAGKGYATKYNVPAATITLLDNGRQWVNWIWENLGAAHDFAQQATAFKNQLFNGTGTLGVPPVPPVFTAMPSVPFFAGVFLFASGVGTGIKTSANYSVADGEDMGTEGALIATPGTPLPPVLKLLASLAGGVSIGYRKDGHQAVKFQVRIAGTLGWTDLGSDLNSPFDDTRPLATSGTPEVREYRACFVDHDAPSNVWSDILPVTVTP